MRITVTISTEKKAKPYLDALVAAGATPEELFLLLPEDSKKKWKGAAQTQGVLFGGGTDVDPPLFGETKRYDNVKVNRARDDHELELFAEVRRNKLPIFGICRGIQVFNVALKGTLYQDIHQDEATKIPHRQTDKDGVTRQNETHSVKITEADCFLAGLLGTSSCLVNSLHHQAVQDVGEGLKVTARSEDGIVEALDLIEPYPFFLAVQWHPEELTHQPAQLGLFRRFVAACRVPA